MTVSPTWRVVTWNILGAKDPDLTAIAAHLRASRADVVALQEVRRRQARRLARLLDWQWAWTRKHYPYSPLVWWRAEGLAILSPTPLRDRRRAVLSVGEPIWVYRHRVMAAATVVRPDGSTLRVYDVHLASHSVDDRIDQARRAAGIIARDLPGSRVVCGDLNSQDEVEVLRELRAVGVRDTGGPVTNPADAPYQRLDYVLVPLDAEVRTVDVPDGGPDWRALSDHLPVLVELTLAPSSDAAPSR